MNKPQPMPVMLPVTELKGTVKWPDRFNPAPADKPESVKPKAKRCHPWRKWVDNPNDKQKEKYNPFNRVPFQDRMGLK